MYYLKIILVAPVGIMAFWAGFFVRAVKNAFEFGGDEFEELVNEMSSRAAKKKEGK